MLGAGIVFLSACVAPDEEPASSSNAIWSVATAPDDAVWVAHSEQTLTETGSMGALVITKLAP